MNAGQTSSQSQENHGNAAREDAHEAKRLSAIELGDLE